MKKQKNRLTSRERLFCAYYANSADMEQSARKAGYKKECQKKALLLLFRKDICDEINRILDIRRKVKANMAIHGYERLAFASVKDAVHLLFMDKEELSKLSGFDLFAVSEVKRLKDGCMEIKFFDKLKALEKLLEFSTQESDATADFLSALSKGPQQIEELEDGQYEN